ncbi:MAG: hypothetical protein Q4B44_00520 [Erysipelotrichaceae bacterium]|nr:hypothetical protein [Erysipelotrichaceae bacterium]
MLYYQPSCSFTAMDPASAKWIREYTSSKEAVTRACCHFDKNTLSEDDTALYFCQECRNVMEGQELRTKSLWQFIDEDADFQFPSYDGREYVLLDCWRDREHPEIHSAVRNLLAKMNVRFTELPKNRENTDFCGTLHFETELYKDEVTSFDHISHFGKKMEKKLMEEKVSQLCGMPVITYCCRCYKGIITGGGRPVHLLTLLAGCSDEKIAEIQNRTIEIMSRPDPRYAMKNMK